MDLFTKLLDNQKIAADAIAVPLTKEELELLIDHLGNAPLTDKQAINTYQKLTEKLETLEDYSKE